MKYLCLVMLDEKKLEAMSGSGLQALDDKSLDYAEMLMRGGHWLGGSPLESTQSATTVRVQSGKVTVTDGPFAESYEQVGGFILIEARDLNEAIQLASKMPAAYLGGIEVRPLRELASSINPERRL